MGKSDALGVDIRLQLWLVNNTNLLRISDSQFGSCTNPLELSLRPLVPLSFSETLHMTYDSLKVSLYPFDLCFATAPWKNLTVFLPFSISSCCWHPLKKDSPETPKKEHGRMRPQQNALWDAKRAWCPTYGLAIRSSNWLGQRYGK